ncbi:DUF397 domain-containing protein [Plantactinospora endophytica]|uniref:DUF397 domain-containing protein n=1 Tax=Plantactinospora endophytica TaxID=673535 RepID=UPI0019411A6A|nr:DUF397 domain-containing protein [Plantactinospora endophytica]
MASEEPEITWCRSSRSIEGNCVETALTLGETVAVRDSKDPPVQLRFATARWSAFLDRIRSDGDATGDGATGDATGDGATGGGPIGAG